MPQTMVTRQQISFIAGVFLLCSCSCQLQSQDDVRQVRVAPKPIKPSSVNVGQRFPSIQAKALDGREFKMQDGRRYRATVVALTSTSCPICRKYTPSLAAIEKAYSARNIRFAFLNPLPSDKASDIRSAISQHGLMGPYIHDKTDQFTKAFQVRTTAEVFVFDKAQTLVYRGAVDDQYGIGYSLDQPKKNFLRDALDAILNGQDISIAATSAPGCDLWQEEKKAAPFSDEVNYHSRISRIIQNNCQDCHREKGLAPFGLESHDEIISHAGMIKTVINNGSMPPWFAKEETQTRWSNDRRLSAADKRDLVKWLESDRKLGNPKDGPVAKEYPSQWNIGSPDETFQIPRPISVKATGTMRYQHAIVHLRNPTEKWIQAVEIRPTDPTVVHHVLVFLSNENSRRRIDESAGFLAAYVPGNSFQKYPTGFAKRLPANSRLVFQIHYTPAGKKTSDQTVIGFKYAKAPPKHLIKTRGIANPRIQIPPGAGNHAETATLRVSTDATILAFMPHMHLRGKAFRYDLVSTHQKQTLLEVPSYDFNWQLEYRLIEPISVSNGDVIKVTGWFDNSTHNPANPDPDQTVRWGPQTDDEMMLGYVEYYLPGQDAAEFKTKNGSKDKNSGLQRQSEARQSSARRRSNLSEMTRSAFQKLDKDQDGKLTRQEVGLSSTFESLDRNGDNFLTVRELSGFQQ